MIRSIRNSERRPLNEFVFASDGAACGILLLLTAVLWRDRKRSVGGLLSVALVLGAAAFAFLSMPSSRLGTVVWQMPLIMLAGGNPAIFWLWARTSFEDDFVPRLRHLVPWVALAGSSLLPSYFADIWPIATRPTVIGLQVVSVALAVLALLQTFRTWREDLVAKRRRLRLIVLAGGAAYIAVLGLSDVIPANESTGTIFVDIVRPIGLYLLAALAGWRLIRITGSDRSLALSPSEITLGKINASPADAELATTSIDSVLLQRLEHLMSVERVHRTDGLTIGMLAARLRVPEYRLRHTINEGLGYRNFNVFLNRYRINEAKAALIDPTQKEVPVLTIAMDAGFRSIGPFNRAFKLETGMTPSDCRRLAFKKGSIAQNLSENSISVSGSNGHPRDTVSKSDEIPRL